jgi:hypothetical protein
MSSGKAKPSASSSSPAPVPGPALEVSTITEEKDLAAMLPVLASSHNEKGETVVRFGSVPAESPGETFYPLFLHNIFVGLVPPFFDFFLAILDHYQIHALHLHPSSTFLLSIFAFYCKAFVGVMPSVALFRHFFCVRGGADHCSGSINFIAADAGNVLSKDKKKVEKFRRRWVFVDAKRSHARLTWPSAPPVKPGCWAREKLADPRAKQVLKKMTAELTTGKLTGALLAREFV